MNRRHLLQLAAAMLVAHGPFKPGSAETGQGLCDSIRAQLADVGHIGGFGGGYDTLDDSTVMACIECLLKFEGDRRLSSVRAGRSLALSSPGRYPFPTIEVEALYECSALFYQTGMHAYAMILEDKRSNQANRRDIRRAYAAYRKWYQRLTVIGLAKARADKLDPLSGTGLSWHGQTEGLRREPTTE